LSNITPLDRYLIGDNPFIGVNHLSQQRARENQNRLNSVKILGIIEAAMNSGAQGLLMSTHPLMYDVLKQMRSKADGPTFGLYPLLPYAQEYVRRATEKGVIGLAREVLAETGLSALVRGLSIASMDPERILRAYVDTELDILFKNAPRRAVLRAVLFHEVITDLAVSFEADQLLKGYVNHILDKYHVRPGFATRNFERFVAFAEKTGMMMDEIVILTPLNKVGFQMNPSKEACERTLDRLGVTNVIAMSILASGILNLDDALKYLGEHASIKSFVVGVSTEVHARETFSQMNRALG
jgi:hypothetical protein